MIHDDGNNKKNQRNELILSDIPLVKYTYLVIGTKHYVEL